MSIPTGRFVWFEYVSQDAKKAQGFFGELFGWTYPAEGAFPGYTFVETGVPGALYTAISPLQGDSDLVTFFVGVEDIASSISDTTGLGGRVVQEPVTVPGVSFALIADPQGHVVGLAQRSESPFVTWAWTARGYRPRGKSRADSRRCACLEAT